nr:ERF family protein [uncultured Anaerocolumna sp.]
MENGKIYEAISNVMAEIGAIGKEKKNLQQGFMYRGIDDVMNALQPALVKHKVFIAPEVISEQREERTTQKGGVLFYTRLEVSYKFYTVDGSFIETKVIGEAMDSGDKATNKAMSIAYKYACFQVFCIPTEEMQDPDADAHEIKADKAEPKKGNKSRQEKSDVPKSEAEMNAAQKEVAAQKIEQTKITVIKNELERTGVSEKAICARYKISNLEDITEELFPRVVSALKNTKSREVKE